MVFDFRPADPKFLDLSKVISVEDFFAYLDSLIPNKK